MKKFTAVIGLVSSGVLFGVTQIMIPYVGIIALIALGGPAALFIGAGAYLFQFVFGYLVQSGLSPFELFLGL